VGNKESPFFGREKNRERVGEPLRVAPQRDARWLMWRQRTLSGLAGGSSIRTDGHAVSHEGGCVTVVAPQVILVGLTPMGKRASGKRMERNQERTCSGPAAPVFRRAPLVNWYLLGTACILSAATLNQGRNCGSRTAPPKAVVAWLMWFRDRTRVSRENSRRWAIGSFSRQSTRPPARRRFM
jgi:hypothetical protein